MTAWLYWAPSVATAAGVVFLFSLGALAFRLGMPSESARKTVHIVSGLVAAIAPALFAREQILAGVFLLGALLPIGASLGWFTGVIRVGRSIVGPLWFVAAYGLLVTVEERHAFIAAPMLVLAVGDAAASLVGSRWGYAKIIGSNGRTWLGSFTFAVCALACSTGVMLVIGAMDPWFALTAALAVALGCAAAEAISFSAMDNFLTPVAAYAILLLVDLWPETTSTNTSLGIQLLLCVAIAWYARRAHWLLDTGALAFLLLGVLLVCAQGLLLALVILAFFISSSLLTRVNSTRQVQQDGKGRGVRQVLALGTLPTMAACAFAVTGDALWNTLGLAAVASATADTWGTELGRLSRTPPRLITTWRRVQPGESGAVSSLGLAASLIGACGIAALGCLLGLTAAPTLVATAGVIGALADSAMGALVQTRYQCPTCGAYNDNPVECHGAAMTRVGGGRCLNNEGVNFAMCIIAVLVCLGLQVALRSASGAGG